MTALMHCAYRGHTEACVDLISKGAEVSSNHQKDGVRQ